MTNGKFTRCPRQIVGKLGKLLEIHCTYGPWIHFFTQDPGFPAFEVFFIIISASLSIKAEQSAYVIDLSSVPCLSAHLYCGKTANWIRMPFGVL